MEFISKQELLQALKDKYGDLTDDTGCNVRTENGYEWLSVADVVEIINGCWTHAE